MKTLLQLAIVLLFATTTFAQDAPQKTAEVEGVSEYRLSNGCRVVLYADASSKAVTVNMTVLVGSRHEGYGETGMAHLLEHMLFKGTPKHGDLDGELKERGALDMNGTTWYDRTNYYETLPAEGDNLEWAIEMEADRLINCFIRAEDLLSEMTVVCSEFEMSENSPSQILMQRVFANAFEWHNYGKSVIGNKADIERVPIPSLRAFYKKYYRPSNVVLFVTGKIDIEETLGLVQKYFGAIENPKTKLPKTYTTEPTQDGERVVYLRRVGGNPTVMTGYHIPAASHPDYAAVQVLSWILGDEPSGRLYQKLVKTEKASSVSASPMDCYDPGLLLCDATFEGDGADAEEFAQEFANIIESVATDGIDPEDVERAKASFARTKEEQVLDAQYFAMTLSDWSAYGDWRLWYLDRDRLAKVTVDDVKRVAEKYLRKSNRTLGLYLPTKEPSRSYVEETPSIAKMVDGYTGNAENAVAAVEAFEPTPENIAATMITGKLASGMPYTLIPKQSRGDKFELKLTLNYGNRSVFSSREMINAAEMLGIVFQIGTTTKDKETVQDLETKFKTGISTSSSTKGKMSFNISGRKKLLAEAMDLLKDVVRNPGFSEEEFKLEKGSTIAYYEEMRNDPQAIAGIKVEHLLAPVDKTSPDYTPEVPEMIDEVKALQLDHLKEVYRMLSGSEGRVTVTGSFDEKLVVEKLNSIMDGWTSDTKFERVTSKPYKVDALAKSIETPDQASAMYMSGANLDVNDKDEDWEALYIAADIIGGGSLDSRLADYVREQNGLSYQVGSSFDAGDFDRAGSYMTYATTNPANKDALVDAIETVHKKVIAEGFTEDEIASAKTTYLEQIESMLSDDFSMGSTVHRYMSLGKDMKALRARLDKVKGLTVEEVNAAAKKLLSRPMVTITAGDFANAKAADKKVMKEISDAGENGAIKATVASLSKALNKTDMETAFQWMTEEAKTYTIVDATFMCKKLGEQAAEMGDPRTGRKLKAVLEDYGLDDLELPESDEESDQFEGIVQSKLGDKATKFVTDARKAAEDFTGPMNDFEGDLEGIEVDGKSAVVKIVADYGPESGGMSTMIHNFKNVDGKWLHDGMDYDAMMAEEAANVGAIGEKLEISGDGYGGGKISIEDFRGKLLVIDFWGTWCAPCVAELPKLKKIKKALSGKNFDMLGIAVDEPAALKGFFKKKGELTWKNIVDAEGAIADEMGVSAFPTKIVIAPDGKHIATPNSTEELVEIFEAHLDLNKDELKKLTDILSEEE